MKARSAKLASFLIFGLVELGACETHFSPHVRGSTRQARARVNKDSRTSPSRKGRHGKRRSKNTLIASMGRYPGYDGDLDVTGTVSVRFGNDRHFFFHVDVKGLGELATGGVHIHEGTTCEEASLVGGHYWNDKRTDDNWTDEGGAVWSADENGDSVSSFRLYSGYGYNHNAGHAVVFHTSDGTRAACGVLEKNNFELSADMGSYPTYNGNVDLTDDYHVSGEVTISFDADGQFEMFYNLDGLPKKCSDCGVHVHTGTTCEDHDNIGDHYFTSAATDLWTTEGGAVYNSNGKGEAKGSSSCSMGIAFRSM